MSPRVDNALESVTLPTLQSSLCYFSHLVLLFNLKTTCFHVTGSSAWDSWVKGTLQTALAAAPLDLAEAWAVAVRFALNALAHTSPQAMQALLHIIIQQPPQGE